MNASSLVLCPFSETVDHLLDENQRYMSHLTSLLHDATQEMEHSVMVQYEVDCANECISSSNKHWNTAQLLIQLATCAWF